MIDLRSKGSVARSVSAWLLALLACECTLNDYSYLGAKRGTESTVGGQGGASDSGGSAAGTSIAASGTSNSTVAVQGGMAGANAAGSGGATSGATGGSANGGRSTTALAGEGGVAGSNSAITGGATMGSTAGRASGGMTNTSGASPGGNAGSNSVPTGGATLVVSGGRATGGSASTSGANNGGSAVGGVGAAAGAPTSCAGCARLDAPFTAKGQVARYYLKFSPTVSINERASGGVGGMGAVTNAGTMKIRAFAPLLGNSDYEVLVQQSSGSYTMCYSTIQPWPSNLTSAWVTLEWSLASCAGDTAIGRIGLDLIAPTAADARVPTTTTIWLDSIWIELNGKTIVGPYNFDAAASVNSSAVANDWEQTEGVLYLRPSIPDSPTGNGTPPTGSAISWFAN